MRDKAAEVIGDRSIRFADADSRRSLIGHIPASQHGLHPVKGCLAARAPGKRSLPHRTGLPWTTHRERVCRVMFAPSRESSGFFTNSLMPSRTIQMSFEQIRMAGKHLPQHREQSLVRPHHFPDRLDPDHRRAALQATGRGSLSAAIPTGRARRCFRFCARRDRGIRAPVRSSRFDRWSSALVWIPPCSAVSRR